MSAGLGEPLRELNGQALAWPPSRRAAANLAFDLFDAFWERTRT